MWLHNCPNSVKSKFCQAIKDPQFAIRSDCLWNILENIIFRPVIEERLRPSSPYMNNSIFLTLMAFFLVSFTKNGGLVPIQDKSHIFFKHLVHFFFAGFVKFVTFLGYYRAREYSDD